jgi:hypothetical protein
VPSVVEAEIPSKKVECMTLFSTLAMKSELSSLAMKIPRSRYEPERGDVALPIVLFLMTTCTLELLSERAAIPASRW